MNGSKRIPILGFKDGLKVGFKSDNTREAEYFRKLPEIVSCSTFIKLPTCHATYGTFFDTMYTVVHSPGADKFTKL